MRYLIFVIFVLSNTVAFAENICKKIEYAELKDMNVTEQSNLFCNYRTEFLFQEHFFDQRIALWKGKEDYMTSQTRAELIKDQNTVNSCKDEMSRVERLLRDKKIDTERLECKCPTGLVNPEPYLKCSI